MKRHHYFQIALFLLYITIATLVMLKEGIGITPDRYFVVLLVGAALIRHSKHFIHDFAPFLFILLAYDFLRGFADNINTHIHYRLPIIITKFMFFGHIPTIDLQQKLYTPGYLHWYDYITSLFYLLHFAVPFVFAFFLWFYNREHFREFMLGLVLVSYAALLFYIIYPTAPPWLAAQNGFLPPVTKILNVVILTIPQQISIPTFYNVIGSNLVAALPSMHAGYSFLVLLFALRFLKKWGWFFIIYVLAMWFTIIYLGEHYLIDIIFGAVLSFVSFLGAHSLMKHYHVVLDKL